MCTHFRSKNWILVIVLDWFLFHFGRVIVDSMIIIFTCEPWFVEPTKKSTKILFSLKIGDPRKNHFMCIMRLYRMISLKFQIYRSLNRWMDGCICEWMSVYYIKWLYIIDDMLKWHGLKQWINGGIKHQQKPFGKSIRVDPPNPLPIEFHFLCRLEISLFVFFVVSRNLISSMAFNYAHTFG